MPILIDRFVGIFVQVIQKLRTLFGGYSEMPPTCFIFCGHFTSQPYGTEHVRILKGTWSTFACYLLYKCKYGIMHMLLQ